MNSLADELIDASDELLTHLGGCSIEELAQKLPSAHTSDVHMLAGELCLRRVEEELTLSDNERQELLWDAFHQLSLTNATLYLHRHQQKLLRLSRSSQKSRKETLMPYEDAQQQSTSHTQDTKDMLAMLPPGWVVVQVSVGVGMGVECGSHLLLESPLFHTLHIARVTTGTDAKLVLQSVVGCDASLLQELERIKQQNKVLNKDYADNVAKYSAMREQLDSRLKCVIRSLEVSWLGMWRCLLAGAVPLGFLQPLEQAVSGVLSDTGEALTQQQVDKIVLMLCCPAVQLSPHLTTTKAAAAGDLHVFQCQLRPAVALLLRVSVRSDRVKNVCSALLHSAAVMRAAENARQAERGPLILLLDKSVVSLPWESMACLRDHPVTRMPSLLSLHLLHQIHHADVTSVLHRGLDPTKGHYLLDPENNLPRTQQRLAAAFDTTGWPGLCAERPSHQRFKEALEDSDVFVYVGHGSGSQYLPGELVEDARCRACVLLYGCSSVRLQPRGRVPDPWGVLLNYLLANSPCVVGMLWEVTDKDTDLLTGNMLDTLAAAKEGRLTPPTHIPGVVAKARHMCNRYLTAAAIVVYGLPCYFRVGGRDPPATGS